MSTSLHRSVAVQRTARAVARTAGRYVYAIRLSVPANTRIEAHSHRDDRSVTVVSGVWYFGYGASFDESALVALPAGSFYTEPPNRPHFARTLEEPVVVHITGHGPTDTSYVDAGDAPIPD